jgi:hypothetical protein
MKSIRSQSRAEAKEDKLNQRTTVNIERLELEGTTAEVGSRSRLRKKECTSKIAKLNDSKVRFGLVSCIGGSVF